jgi:hypothetical protein
MKNILLIGVGGTGSKTVDTLFQKIKELNPQTENNISAIVFDTDVGDIRKIESATPIPMADNASVGTICDRIGTEYIKEWDNIYKAHEKAFLKGAMFDARCFSIPKEEVCNYFQWRQMDCVRNSIQMVGQANFSHKELQNKKNEDIQEMLFSQKGINWNDFSTVKKRGSCCVKDFEKKVINFQTQEEVTRKIWGIDKNIPIFSQDRNYIERFV